MNETEKLIEEQFKTLSPALQQAINTVPWKNLVQEIGKQNNLTDEQIFSLEQETMFIIYAFENPNDYVSNITKNVGVSEEVAYTIAELAANKIFDPILKKAEELEQQKTSIPQIPPTNLPMVEEGEVAHTVDSRQYIVDSEQKIVDSRQEIVDGEKQETEKPRISLPDYRYPNDKDPYREPLK